MNRELTSKVVTTHDAMIAAALLDLIGKPPSGAEQDALLMAQNTIVRILNQLDIE